MDRCEYIYCFQSCDVEKGLDNPTGCGVEKLNNCKHISSSAGKPGSHVLIVVLKRAALLVLAALVISTLWYFFGWMIVIEVILVAIVAFLAAGGGYRWLIILYKTLPRDLKNSNQQYNHHTVNHCENFVDPGTGAHTNTVERMWGVAKSSFRKRFGNHSQMLDSYLCDFMWRKRLPNQANPFEVILEDIAAYWPPVLKLNALQRYLRFLWSVRSLKKKDMSIGEVFAQHVEKRPNDICFIFEDKEWTFAQVEEFSNRVANVFKAHGLKNGDAVALMMDNRPEFVCFWLGLSKLGVVTALINTNLRQSSLGHSISVANSKAFIYSSIYSEAVAEVASSLVDVRLFNWSKTPRSSIGANEINLEVLLKDAATTAPSASFKVGFNDKLLYIYTSGTTGLPKAAVITHCRYVFMAGAIHYQVGFSCKDRYYTPLPLYHTAGGAMAAGQAVVYGSTVVIRSKFSASNYFADIVKYNCTVGQYIGEMCRYLLSTPPRPEDKNHKLRMIFGNGLRPQIWKEFVERFNIPKVAEFYGATEGNANIANIDNKEGAIGFVSRLIPSIYPISIIRVDQKTGEPLRNEQGLCMTCQPGEPGVFIGKIIATNPARAFLGYVNEKESKKKIVYDVFTKGDSAFLSGDLLVMDEWGYLYFKDRTGDTFRWKGENVSTSEVEGIVSNHVNYKDCVVYGVEIPSCEGRAGMAAIVDEHKELDLEALAKGLTKALPPYARPVFLRIVETVELTGTYKLKKLELQKEGFDPDVIKDQLYYLSSNGTYELLTSEGYKKILEGVIRF